MNETIVDFTQGVVSAVAFLAIAAGLLRWQGVNLDSLLAQAAHEILVIAVVVIVVLAMIDIRDPGW